MEAGWKYLNKDKSYEGKVKEIFSCFNFLNDAKNVRSPKASDLMKNKPENIHPSK